MKILHYALGFPPFRTGGMTKYCLDLMAEQLKCGHEVGMLWPGTIRKYDYAINIKKAKSEEIGYGIKCESYEIINPLPVSLLNGIKDIDAFTQCKDESIFYSFLKENKIEVIHIHTLMGLPKECIDVAKKLNIRLIYTTHDYYGLCPKWGLMCEGKVCDDDNDCKKCVKCNETSLSLSKIKILQSNLYKCLKNSKIVSLLRKKHNDSLYKDSSKKVNILVENYTDEIVKKAEQYKTLRQFYIEMLQRMDIIHFNSSNTEKIFKRYFCTEKNGRVLSITHSSIKDGRKIRNYEGKLNLGYLGPITEHKGFYALKQVCDNLNSKYEEKFNLHIFADYGGNEPYMVKHKPYKYDELSNVMDAIDILIVPSLWNETFGFTVLEALSYGVPVIVSKNVGAKDLINPNKSGIIFDNNIEELKKVIIDLFDDLEQKLKKMNNYIVIQQNIKTIKEHVQEVIKYYK